MKFEKLLELLKPMLLQRTTCVAPPPSRLAAKKAAFTLAEVLITLGIIGVVAALTLPIVINKAQSMILKNQFKRLILVFITL